MFWDPLFPALGIVRDWNGLSIQDWKQPEGGMGLGPRGHQNMAFEHQAAQLSCRIPNPALQEACMAAGPEGNHNVLVGHPLVN